MATVTHYIRSDYNPDTRETLERETGQTSDTEESGKEVDVEEEWRKEATRLSFRGAQRPAPRFVAATVSYDDWGDLRPSSSKPEMPSSSSLGPSVSGWYKTLTSSQTEFDTSPSGLKGKVPTITRPSSAPTEHFVPAIARKLEGRNKNNWFITKVIQSEPSPSSSPASPSLADILARDPPPLPSQSKYTPPVFLQIGPSNKGFGLLQRSGWNEGEPLGPDVVRRKPVKTLLPDEDLILSEKSGRRGNSPLIDTSSTKVSSQRKTTEVKVEGFGDPKEPRIVEIIDLTLSDSELDDAELESIERRDKYTKLEEDECLIPPDNIPPSPSGHTSLEDTSAYGRKALLTPIATVLKSDRLGIGLKAKTTGPYKASQKRVTHNAAALNAHVKASEESRIRRKLYGRGHRGFERQHRREEEKRKAMLSYLKGL